MKPPRPRAPDPNRSVWLTESSPYEPGPPLRGVAAADVVILGGGLTGVSTAWHLVRRFPGRRVVLLEAETLGNGASGRNGGQALPWVNGFEPRSPGEARRIYEVTCRGIDALADAARECGVDAGFSRRGCLDVQTTVEGAEASHARVEEARRAGIPLAWRPASSVPLRGATGAVFDPAGARVNTAALVRGLRAVLLERGAAVFEGTPALGFEEGERILVRTPQGEVRAASAVLATGAYSPSLGRFRDGLLAIHSHVLATAPLPEERWKTLGWEGFEAFSDDRDRIAYGCRTAGGRLVFGGGENRAYAYLYGGRPVFPEGDGARGLEAVSRRLREYFPSLAGVPLERSWSGVLDVTLDRVCTIGVSGERRNVYHALGYGGHGLALAMLAGEVIADLYAGNHDPWRDLPFYQRRLRRLPPEPLRWIGYQLYTRATGRSPRRRA